MEEKSIRKSLYSLPASNTARNKLLCEKRLNKFLGSLSKPRGGEKGKHSFSGLPLGWISKSSPIDLEA